MTDENNLPGGRTRRQFLQALGAAVDGVAVSGAGAAGFGSQLPPGQRSGTTAIPNSYAFYRVLSTERLLPWPGNPGSLNPAADMAGVVLMAGITPRIFMHVTLAASAIPAVVPNDPPPSDGPPPPPFAHASDAYLTELRGPFVQDARAALIAQGDAATSSLLTCWAALDDATLACLIDWAVQTLPAGAVEAVVGRVLDSANDQLLRIALIRLAERQDVSIDPPAETLAHWLLHPDPEVRRAAILKSAAPFAWPRALAGASSRSRWACRSGFRRLLGRPAARGRCAAACARRCSRRAAHPGRGRMARRAPAWRC